MVIKLFNAPCLSDIDLRVTFSCGAALICLTRRLCLCYLTTGLEKVGRVLPGCAAQLPLLVPAASPESFLKYLYRDPLRLSASSSLFRLSFFFWAPDLCMLNRLAQRALTTNGMMSSFFFSKDQTILAFDRGLLAVFSRAMKANNLGVIN